MCIYNNRLALEKNIIRKTMLRLIKLLSMSLVERIDDFYIVMKVKNYKRLHLYRPSVFKYYYVNYLRNEKR